MKVETLSYSTDRGWSVPSFPSLDSERTLVVVFASPEFKEDPGCIAELKRAYPRSRVIGCSSAGEILGTKISDGSLSVAVVSFREATLKMASARVDGSPQDSFKAGATIARELAGPGLKGVLVFSEGLHVNGSELVKGLNSEFGGKVVVTGGLAGDGDRFQDTWVIEDGRVMTGTVSAVGLYGERLHIGHGSQGGWDLFGPERVVTRSDGNILYQLDEAPALELYKKYLGDRASGLPATALLFPLCIRSDPGDEKRLVRTVLSVDDARQTMTFAGDVPQGWRAQLMRANFDRLVEGASDAALMTRQSGNGTAGGNGASGSASGNGATLAIAISCVGRRLVLGERSEEEVEATLEILPEGTHQIGFYSYGEISPYASGSCDLHNQTMTLTTIAEL